MTDREVGRRSAAGEPRRIGAIADELQVESPHVTGMSPTWSSAATSSAYRIPVPGGPA
ncbi:hypothetical protein [Sphaerisporangium album]|uniref:hypothetical protein n=1 Tax=Sphaerisporangium album TaxID=509200 RepID=UPI0015F097A3|nr:hypothetical protein [Sphaerisporangium album]